MKSRTAALVAALLLLPLGSPRARGQDDGVPAIEPLLGGRVRPGRPFVVRARGTVVRLRAPDGPWALPRGAASNEFVVHTRIAGLGAFHLEVDTGSQVSRVPLELEALPESGIVAAVFVGTSEGTEPGMLAVSLPRMDAPPTLMEAWSPFDRLPSAPTGWPAAAQDALERAAAARRSGGDPPLEPSRLGEGLAAFRAAAAAARTAPALPSDVVIAALLAAATSVSLLVLVRRRRPAERLGWTAVPAALFIGWCLLGGALPGAVRGSALAVLEGTHALVLVRVEAPYEADVTFGLPAAAEDATLLRFSPDDRTAPSVEIGDRVRCRLGPGEHRVIAYRVPLGSPPPSIPLASPPAADIVAFLRSMGRVAAGHVDGLSDALPRDGAGVRVLLGSGLVVRSRSAPGK